MKCLVWCQLKLVRNIGSKKPLILVFFIQEADDVTELAAIGSACCKIACLGRMSLHLLCDRS